MDSYRINPDRCQQIAFNSSTSTKSTNSINATEVVLYSTVDCFVNFSDNPTATATGAANVFVPAQTFLPVKLASGTNHLAAIGSTSAGTLYINALVGGVA